MNKLQNEHNKQLSSLKLAFAGQLKDLENKYETKVKELREDLELRRKVEIHEIEERKNQHRNDLTKSHEEAFKSLKSYYNSITKNNLQLIKD